MKERPILFSGPMIRAILEGRKTMTRRVAIPRYDDRTPCEHWQGSGSNLDAIMFRHCPHGSEGRDCPHGLTEDRLWVRETFAVLELHAFKNQTPGSFIYAADKTTSPNLIFRPSIFMPRWASRITLEVTGVKVERLTDITQEDAAREGVEGVNTGDFITPFATLWNSINSKRGFGWDTNCYVWVLTFKRV